MKLKTIHDFNLAGKKVLLRVDINSELKNKKPVLNDRITEHAKTIKELQKKKAQVIVLAHQGRRGGEDFTSLKEHTKLLNKYAKIKFVPDIFGKRAVTAIQNLKNGEAILLENVRSLEHEDLSNLDNPFTKTLSKECDIYLNDAFSIVHRSQASITSFPRIMKNAGIGPVMEKELKNISKLKKMKNVLYILGGSKTDNILLMKKGRIITDGIWGHLCLMAKKQKLGKQEESLEKKFSKISKELRKKVLGARTPMDFAISSKGKRKEIDISELPINSELFDIGEKTIKQYTEIIKRADAIFMKGPAGYCEDKKFCKGTFSLLKAISKNSGFSVLSGGHLGTAMLKAKIPKNKINYISLSGGALVWYLAGKKLPGLEVLKR